MKQPTYFPSSAPHRIAHDPPGPQPTSHACLLAQAHLSPCPAPYCRFPTQSPISKCQFHPSGSGGAAHAGRSRGAGAHAGGAEPWRLEGPCARTAAGHSRRVAQEQTPAPCCPARRAASRPSAAQLCSSAGKRARAAGLRAAGGQPKQ